MAQGSRRAAEHILSRFEKLRPPHGSHAFTLDKVQDLIRTYSRYFRSKHVQGPPDLAVDAFVYQVMLALPTQGVDMPAYRLFARQLAYLELADNNPGMVDSYNEPGPNRLPLAIRCNYRPPSWNTTQVSHPMQPNQCRLATVQIDNTGAQNPQNRKSLRTKLNYLESRYN